MLYGRYAKLRLYIIDRNNIFRYLLKVAWVMLLLTSIIFMRKSAIAVFSVPIRSAVVVIDAGHGGIDPGASGNRGVKEGEINLEIAMKLRRLIEQGGGSTVMIREDDSGLYKEGESTQGTKKERDLKNRHTIINGCGADILISIHANSFPQSKYFGAQTFFLLGDEKSQRLAESIQNEAIRVLNRGNERKAKSTDSIYILKNNDMPGALVECGFLSNHEEERLLEDGHYQEKVAWSIFAGIVKYLEAERERE